MGKGVILNHISAGQYRIRLLRNSSRAQSAISRLTYNRNQYDTVYLPNAQAVMDEAYRAWQDSRDKINTLISGGATIEEIKAEVIRRESISSRYFALKTRYDTLKSERDSIATKLLYIQNNLTSDPELDAWCADYTLDLSGNVGTIEVPGELRDDKVWIQPGYEGNGAYSQSRDGQLFQTPSMTTASTVYNWALQPGWEKWKPLYRTGTITAIIGNTCSITLDPESSGFDSLNVNVSNTLTNVPFRYMECDSEAFQLNDNVVIEFTGQDYSSPVVIGFKDHPRPCVQYIGIRIRCNGYSPTWGNITVKIIYGPGASEMTYTTALSHQANLVGPFAVGYLSSPTYIHLYCARRGSGLNLWQAGHSYSQYDLVHPITPTGFEYIAQNSGTSGTNEPKWPFLLGGTVVDGSITWKRVTAETGYSSLFSHFYEDSGSNPHSSLALNVSLNNTYIEDPGGAIDTYDYLYSESVSGSLNASRVLYMENNTDIFSLTPVLETIYGLPVHVYTLDFNDLCLLQSQVIDLTDYEICECFSVTGSHSEPALSYHDFLPPNPVCAPSCHLSGYQDQLCGDDKIAMWYYGRYDFGSVSNSEAHGVGVFSNQNGSSPYYSSRTVTNVYRNSAVTVEYLLGGPPYCEELSGVEFDYHTIQYSLAYTPKSRFKGGYTTTTVTTTTGSTISVSGITTQTYLPSSTTSYSYTTGSSSLSSSSSSTVTASTQTTGSTATQITATVSVSSTTSTFSTLSSSSSTYSTISSTSSISTLTTVTSSSSSSSSSSASTISTTSTISTLSTYSTVSTTTHTTLTSSTSTRTTSSSSTTTPPP